MSAEFLEFFGANYPRVSFLLIPNNDFWQLHFVDVVGKTWCGVNSDAESAIEPDLANIVDDDLCQDCRGEAELDFINTGLNPPLSLISSKELLHGRPEGAEVKVTVLSTAGENDWWIECLCARCKLIEEDPPPFIDELAPGNYYFVLRDGKLELST